MADKILVFNEVSGSPDTIENFYGSPSNGSGTKIKAFTVTNDTGSNKSYKAYIYSSSEDLVKSIIPFSIVVKDTADYGPSAIGQVIPAGGSLRIESSDADSLNFYVTGADQ